MIRPVVCVIAIALAAAGCGVSKSKYAQVTHAADSLTMHSQQLQKNLDAANAQNQTLQQQVASMQSSVDQLNTELEKQKQATSSVQSTYDDMVSQLKNELASGEIEIQQMRDGIRVNLAQDILFQSGSASLDKDGKELLTKVSDELKKSDYEVMVIGHTDNQKIKGKLAQKYPTNIELGGARAGSVLHQFEANGIVPTRLLAISAGESRPRADNATEEGRKLNRRIEILLRPIKVETPTAAEH
jgi:chemotaxis protein MotB